MRKTRNAPVTPPPPRSGNARPSLFWNVSQSSSKNDAEQSLSACVVCAVSHGRLVRLVCPVSCVCPAGLAVLLHVVCLHAPCVISFAPGVVFRPVCRVRLVGEVRPVSFVCLASCVCCVRPVDSALSSCSSVSICPASCACVACPVNPQVTQRDTLTHQIFTSSTQVTSSNHSTDELKRPRWQAHTTQLTSVMYFVIRTQLSFPRSANARVSVWCLSSQYEIVC